MSDGAMSSTPRRDGDEAVVIPAPLSPLSLSDVQTMKSLHATRGLRLATANGLQADLQLADSPAAAVAALLSLAEEALRIHAVAEALPWLTGPQTIQTALANMRRT